MLPVDPLQVNFPCIHKVIELVCGSTEKKTGLRTTGRRLYLSDQAHPLPEQMLTKVRQRWNLENKNHHPRDATFMEDKARCRKGNTTANLALLRGLALNLWRKTTPDAPAPAFISKAQRNLDAFIDFLTTNQRLTKME